MQSIPFYSLHAQHKLIEKKVTLAFSTLYNEGRFVLGEKLRFFEEAFARYMGGQFCVGVGNGLDAIFIALKALHIGPGDEVIVPSHTYIATWLAVSRTGAIPVPVEVDSQSWLIDPEKIEDKITPKTRAIIAVHLYGLVCDMPRITAIAKKYNLKVVEDNAQATGASIDGKKSGTWGHINAFSFYPTKTLGALGDGGAVVTDHEEQYRFALAYRNYGSAVQYVNEMQGINSRLDDMQAAFLNIKLSHLQEWNNQRKDIAAIYKDQLHDVNGLEMPQVIVGSDPVYHLFPIKVKHRDSLRAHLEQRGIHTSIHYPTPPYLQNAYRESGFRKGAFPFTEELAQDLISLPIWPGLQPSDVLRICAEIRKVSGSQQCSKQR